MSDWRGCLGAEDIWFVRMLRWGRCRVGENANLGKMSGVLSWGGCQDRVDVMLGRMSGWRGCRIGEDFGYGRMSVLGGFGLNNMLG